MKWKTVPALVRDLEKLRRKNPKVRIVFTNGVFDVLHRGHLDYLQRARKLGDFLIVALNSDASVRQLKGPTRPVHRQQDRAFMLSGFECVDAVCGFTEQTPLKTILKLRPDILVKGGDYKISTIVGAKEVQSWGGKVRVLPFVEGHSTTRILEDLKK